MKHEKPSFGMMCMYIFLVLVLLVMLIPFIWLIISSFRPNADLFNAPFEIPGSLSFDNYIQVLKSHPMFLYFGNTVAVAFMAAVVNITVSVAACYALMYKFRIKPIIAFIFYIGLFIPTNAFMVPYYVMVNKVGLYDNVIGLALVYAGVNLPMSLMVIKAFMDTIPAELLESARIDGATSRQVLVRVVLPVSVPSVVTACIFIVINSWNELLFANLLNQSDHSRTIQVAIRSFLTTFEANYAYAFAAMVISILPTVIVYALLTDKIIGGMTAGAVKG